MTHTCTRVLLVSSLLFINVLPARGADSIPDADEPRVRILDARFRTLFQEGLNTSPTFRALVTRLEASDVVVYLLPDLRPLSGVGGRLTILSVVGDVRYVVIRLKPLGSPVQQLAMMAHELQHAVEVAERPAIVDQITMLEEYERIGYASGGAGGGVTFDTRAAIEAGTRVADELRAAGSRPSTGD